jgi:hypothetical protein
MMSKAPSDLAQQFGGSQLGSQPPQTDSKPFLSKVGDFFTGSTQKFGQTAGEAIAAPKNTEMYQKAVTDFSNGTNLLLKAIKLKEQNGGDASHLQTALEQHLSQTPKIEDFVGQDTANRLNQTLGQNAEEIGGQALGTVLEATSGGALGGLGGGATTTLGKIGQGAKVGATYGALSGASNSMQEGKDLTGVLTDTAVGGAVGGVTGGAIAGVGEGLKALVNKLPNRLVRSAIPGLDEKGAKYALENKPIGTVGKMFKDSADAVVNLNSQIDTILKHPDIIDEKVNTPKLFNEILYGKFGNSEYTDKTLIQTMKSLVPEKAKLIDKLVTGDASYFEANEIKKALYQQTKKQFTDNPSLTSKKILGANIATTIADTIKNNIDETKPIFEKMSKEINLRDLLLKAFKKQDAQKMIGLYDLGTIVTGNAVGGVPGAIASEAGRKLINNPASKFVGAKALNAIGKTKGLPTIINKLNQKL